MISKEERDKISNWINNQEGRRYPCSNQIVCCGFVTDDNEKWQNFIEQNKDSIEKLTKREIVFDSRERWIKIPLNSSFRGYRYYKIKVDKNIDKNFLEQVILPCCANYCCELEWI